MIPLPHSWPYTPRPHAGSGTGPPHHLPRAAMAALLPASQSPAVVLLRRRRPCPGEGQTHSTLGGGGHGPVPSHAPAAPPVLCLPPALSPQAPGHADTTEKSNGVPNGLVPPGPDRQGEEEEEGQGYIRSAGAPSYTLQETSF